MDVFGPAPENVVRWYFAFHKPEWRPISAWMGHVDVFCMTETGVWVFLYPQRTGFKIMVCKEEEAIDALFADALYHAHVLRYDTPGEFVLPPLTVYSCAAVCGHMVGIRAFTPRALKRKLLRNGAEAINEQGTKFSRRGDASPA